MDETWVYTVNPGIGAEAAEWVSSRSELSKRIKVNQNTPKAMACVWWDSEGILLIEWMKKGENVKGEEYRRQLEKVASILEQKRPNRPRRKPLFLQDNASCHKAKETIAKIAELGWKTVSHPPFSPDMAPSDFFLFSALKRFLRKKRGHVFRRNKVCRRGLF